MSYLKREKAVFSYYYLIELLPCPKEKLEKHCKKEKCGGLYGVRLYGVRLYGVRLYGVRLRFGIQLFPKAQEPCVYSYFVCQSFVDVTNKLRVYIHLGL